MSLSLREGRLLVAAPELLDPNFARAVVLLCRHDVEGGSFGLVLNRPTDVTLGRILPGFAEGRDEPVWVGGPVDGRCLWILHRHSELAAPGDRIGDGVFFGGDRRLLRRLLVSPIVDREGRFFRAFVGYAGWGEGQLEAEIAEGAWQVVPAGPEALFSESPAGLWDEMQLRSLLPIDEATAGSVEKPWRN